MEELIFDRESLLFDIAGMAYVVADIKEGMLDAHALHQTFDICSDDNVGRVDSLLAMAFAEAAMVMGEIVSPISGFSPYCDGNPPREFRLILRAGLLCPAAVAFLREAVREFMMARVLFGWLSVTLPEAAGVWEERAAGARRRMEETVRASQTVVNRRVSPL